LKRDIRDSCDGESQNECPDLASADLPTMQPTMPRMSFMFPSTISSGPVVSKVPVAKHTDIGELDSSVPDELQGFGGVLTSALIASSADSGFSPLLFALAWSASCYTDLDLSPT
jgi:hypothetical protein